MNIETILESIPDKKDFKNTTSLKFKKGLIEYFKDLNLNRCIEVGTHVGYTTRILSFLFNEIITLEIHMPNITEAQKINKDRSNITFMHGDAYSSDWDIPNSDASFIDCVHTYNAVKYDIENSLKKGVKYLIFDDYGLFSEVKRAVDDFISQYPDTSTTGIGEPPGSKFRDGREFKDWEGIIIKLNNIL